MEKVRIKQKWIHLVSADVFRRLDYCSLFSIVINYYVFFQALKISSFINIDLVVKRNQNNFWSFLSTVLGNIFSQKIFILQKRNFVE